ncbi:unnamed protein product [Microthlaspi erraticum]|uniref:Uncharacterized protein n=1 Tax=Microthlaspi erraticum TaxID=1685480 RepID=A0A6D2JK83_9BRAS|nr:unnamed protein product [Microthlaspi erraticum]
MKKEEIHLLLQSTRSCWDVNVQPQAEQTIGDYDSADAFFTDRNPIHPPLPARNDYEIKPQIIALVRQNQFNGLPAEHPLDHIENFEEFAALLDPMESQLTT